MICEEDKKLIEEAKTCNDCLCWHKYCKAECCKVIFLNISLEHFNKSRKFIEIRKPLNWDQKWYYELRGVKCLHGLIRFPKEYCFYTGRRIIYSKPCELLEGYLCKGHPKNKPKLCQVLTAKTADSKDYGFEITDNCLFKYKEVSEIGEEEIKGDERESGSES